MSTKTTFKRIALATVAAMGFGLLSVVPTSAAVQSDSLTLASTTASGTVGTAATNVITLSFLDDNAGADTITATVAVLSSPVTSTALATVAETEAQNTANPAGATTSSSVFSLASAGAGRVTASATVSLNPDVAGTYVVRITPAGGLNTTSQTWTLTVAAPTVAASNAFISSTTGAAPTVDDAATLLAASATTATAAKARIRVNQWADAAKTTLIGDAFAGSVVVAVSGAGSVGLADSTANRGPSATTTLTAGSDFYVFSDGRTGTATITITVAGTLLSTKSYVFFGTGSALKQDLTVAPKTLVGIGETDTLTFVVTDSLGNITGNNTAIDFAVSSDTAVATVAAVNGVVTVTGVAKGSATITVCNTAACTAATISGTTTVKIASVTVASVKMAFDKDEYSAGEKMTLTVSAFDSAGDAIADGARNLFTTAPVNNIALVGPANGDALVNGKKTYTYYAPLASGPVTFAGTDVTTAAAAVSATANVINPSAVAAQSANDAAAEATDAANAATDAANAAAEAADAATAAAQDAADAVAALSTQVSEMISALKKQITALTNLVIKIQKKVKA